MWKSASLSSVCFGQGLHRYISNTHGGWFLGEYFAHLCPQPILRVLGHMVGIVLRWATRASPNGCRIFRRVGRMGFSGDMALVCCVLLCFVLRCVALLVCTGWVFFCELKRKNLDRTLW